jgi:hypothetical protein
MEGHTRFEEVMGVFLSTGSQVRPGLLLRLQYSRVVESMSNRKARSEPVRTQRRERVVAGVEEP